MRKVSQWREQSKYSALIEKVNDSRVLLPGAISDLKWIDITLPEEPRMHEREQIYIFFLRKS